MKTKNVGMGIAVVGLALLGVPTASAVGLEDVPCNTDVLLGANDTPYLEHLNSTGPFEIGVRPDGTIYFVVFTPIPFASGGWYHVYVSPCGPDEAALLVACLLGTPDPLVCVPA